MRISTSQIYNQHRNNILSRQNEFAMAQNEVSTGKRIQKLSDDPIQAGRLLKIRSVEREITQYTQNLRAGKDYLTNSEQALGDVQGIMKRAYTIAVQGANTSTGQDARTALSQEIASMKERLIGLANSRGSVGQYIFAGQINDATPYQVSGNTLVYNGDANAIRIETGPGETLTVNTIGGNSFIEAYDALASLQTNLLAGNPGLISGSNIEPLKQQAEKFGTMKGEVGLLLRRVSNLEDFNLRRKDELIAQGSEIEDVDMVDAMFRLNQSQTAYQAALQTASSGMNLSLLDYLR